MKRGTLCVQGGWQPKNGEPRVVPIYQSTTFKYESSDEMGRLFDLEASGYFYTRLQNPTNDTVAAKIAALEGGVAALLTASGQTASFYAILNLCSAGDHVVCASEIYGGTFNLFAVTMKRSTSPSSTKTHRRRRSTAPSDRTRRPSSARPSPTLPARCWTSRSLPA